VAYDDAYRMSATLSLSVHLEKTSEGAVIPLRKSDELVSLGSNSPFGQCLQNAGPVRGRVTHRSAGADHKNGWNSWADFEFSIAPWRRLLFDAHPLADERRLVALAGASLGERRHPGAIGRRFGTGRTPAPGERG